MKKLLITAIIIMMVPFTAFGLSEISEIDMDDVTGQAGVTVDLDQVDVDISMSTLTYTDTDADDNGQIIISGLNQELNIDGTFAIDVKDVDSLGTCIAITIGGTAGAPLVITQNTASTFDIALGQNGGTSTSFGTVGLEAAVITVEGTVNIAPH